MYRIRRNVALSAGAAASAVILAGCGSSGSAASASATSSPPGACTLKADLVQLHGVAAGSVYWDVVLTNTGHTACTLPAQPNLDVLSSDHKQIPVKMSTDPTAKPFALAPGASAAMSFGYGSDSNPPCDLPTTYLRITPPGVELPFRSTPHCAQDGITTSVWVAGDYAPAK